MKWTRRQALGSGILAGLGASTSAWGSRFYTQEAFQSVMLADPGELDLAAPVAEGALPAGLVGARYYLNGPARLVYDGVTIHPLDGHGYVRKFDFLEDGVRLRSRFVRTPVFNDDEAEGRVTSRGLGTLVADPSTRGGRKANRKAPFARNPANTTVVAWGDRLLCGYEGGRPWTLDPDSLDTVGEESFGGALGTRFLAHMKVDRDAGRLLGLSPGDREEPRYRFLEVGRNGQVERQVPFEHQGPPPMVHDFSFTADWFVLTNNPLKIRLARAPQVVRGRAPVFSVVDGLADKPCELVLVSRRDDRVVRIPLDRPVLSIHHVNSYALDDGRLVIHLCSVPGLGFGNEFGFTGPTTPLDAWAFDNLWGQRLLRIVADPVAGTADVTQHDKPVMDFPRIHPARDGQRCRFMVAGCRSRQGYSFPYDSVAAVDLDDPERPADIWVAGQGRFVGEPIWMAPADSRSEDDGWVVVTVYDGVRETSHLCVLDPRAVAAGPVARIDLPLMAHGFHGWGVGT